MLNPSFINTQDILQKKRLKISLIISSLLIFLPAPAATRAGAAVATAQSPDDAATTAVATTIVAAAIAVASTPKCIATAVAAAAIVATAAVACVGV